MRAKHACSLFAVALAFMMATEVSAQGITPAETNDMVAENETDDYAVSDNTLLSEEKVYTYSGSPQVSRLTKTDIAEWIDTVERGVPFRSTSFLWVDSDSADSCVSLLRTLAGMPEFNPFFNYHRESDAVAKTMAACDSLDISVKPDGIDDDVYKRARNNKNLCYVSSGTPVETNGFPDYTTNKYPDYILKMVRDNDNVNDKRLTSYIKTVYHRTQFLGPAIYRTGYGYEVSASGKAYTAIYLGDISNSDFSDYDFIAWPASGDFPSAFMGAGDSWSVSLNPDRFKMEMNQPLPGVSVKITAPDGTSRTLTEADKITENEDICNPAIPFYEWNLRYKQDGSGNAIVFRPGTDLFGSDELSGKYTVTITGLKDISDAPVTISYTIDFFRYQDYIPSEEKPVTTEDKVSAFVKRLYDKCMGRSCDEGEVKYWRDLLLSGTMTGAETAQSFFFSAEMKQKNLSELEFVDTLYTVMLNRNPSLSEEEYWIDIMHKGVSSTRIFTEFVYSREFSGICRDYDINRGDSGVDEWRDANIGVTLFISRLYTEALNREYDLNGLNYWCQCFCEGTYSLGQIASDQFFHTPEFYARGLSDSDYIKVLYRTFMGRDYDDEGLNYWLNQMHVCGMSRDDVLESFSDCPEFNKIMEDYGVKKGSTIWIISPRSK